MFNIAKISIIIISVFVLICIIVGIFTINKEDNELKDVKEEKKEEKKKKHQFFRIAFKSPLSTLPYTFILGIVERDKIDTMMYVGDMIESFEEECHCKLSFAEEIKLNDEEEKRYLQKLQESTHRFQPIEEIIKTEEGEKENEK